jgi:WD40 repeat protein/uncharacterized caspase-like protein
MRLPIMRSLLAAAAALIFTFGPGTLPKAVAEQPGPAAAVETVPNVRNDPRSLAFSNDGFLALSGGGSGPVDIWDVRSGRLIRTLSGHRDEVLAVASVSDGRQVLSASRDNTVKLWDTATGRLLRSVQLAGQTEWLSAMAISPDGSRVLSGNNISDVRLWDAATGRLLKIFKSESIFAVVFSADGTRAASSGSHVSVWDLAGGRLLHTFNHASGGSVIKGLAFSHDGARLVSGAYDKTAKLWDVASGRLLRTFVHSGSVSSVSISPDGTRIAAGGSHNVNLNMQVWDATDGRLLYTRQHSYGPNVLFAPDGRHILAGTEGAPLQIKFWEVETGSLVRDFGGDTETLGAPQFSRDGFRIVSGGVSLQQWDAGTAQLLSTTLAPEQGTSSLAFSNDGSRVVWKMPDGKGLKFADAQTGRVISTFLGHTETVSVAAISPDGSRIASGGGFNEKSVKLWEASTGHLLRTIPIASVNAIALSPDGTRLLVGSFNKTAELWDLATGQRIRTFAHTAAVWALAFSSDGTRILTGDAAERTSKVFLWDVASGKLLRTLSGHTASIFGGVAFSPDGKFALSGSYDKTLKYWDLETGQLVRSIESDGDSPAFSPDGRRALNGDAIWDLATGNRLVSIIKSANDQWLAMTPEGFFAASEHGAEMLSVARGIDVWSIDQFYQSLYRPDLVREKLAGDPRGLVRQAATQLDLTKVIASGNAPDVRLIVPGRAVGSATVDGTSAAAEAEITDRGGGIGRVEWRINGVTVGIDAPAAGTPSPLRLARSLALEPGDNAVEVTAYNGANLVASVAARLNVLAQTPAPFAAPQTAPSSPPIVAAKPRLFVLAAGINDYADQRFKLEKAVWDAQEVARGFKEASGSLYQSVEVKLLTDAGVTQGKLDAAFGELSAKAAATDVFVLYLAGHGKTVDGRYYFAPQDFAVEGELTEQSINAAVKAKAISQEQWQRWFAGIPARRSVMLFDTCESGTLADDETQQLQKGAANDRLVQATGRSILAASGGSQEALEGYHGHGLFTYEVLDAINDADGDHNGTIELNELAAYVYAEVSEVSERVFRQRQVPQMKLTANYALAKRMRILQDEATPVAAAKPTYKVAQAAQLQVRPGPGATVVRSLSARSDVTVLESKNGWSLIASDGKPLGYVATRDLAPMQ